MEATCAKEGMTFTWKAEVGNHQPCHIVYILYTLPLIVWVGGDNECSDKGVQGE